MANARVIAVALLSKTLFQTSSGASHSSFQVRWVWTFLFPLSAQLRYRKNMRIVILKVLSICLMRLFLANVAAGRVRTLASLWHIGRLSTSDWTPVGAEQAQPGDIVAFFFYLLFFNTAATSKLPTSQSARQSFLVCHCAFSKRCLQCMCAGHVASLKTCSHCIFRPTPVMSQLFPAAATTTDGASGAKAKERRFFLKNADTVAAKLFDPYDVSIVTDMEPAALWLSRLAEVCVNAGNQVLNDDDFKEVHCTSSPCQSHRRVSNAEAALRGDERGQAVAELQRGKARDGRGHQAQAQRAREDRTRTSEMLIYFTGIGEISYGFMSLNMGTRAWSMPKRSRGQTEEAT